MTTSLASTSLCKPVDDSLIPLGTLGYFQARNRNRMYELVLAELAKSGISQATLARRLGKRPDLICRWLGAPGNWGLDTVSDLLFGISGSEANYSVTCPFDGATRNYNAPEWLTHTLHFTHGGGKSNSVGTTNNTTRIRTVRPETAAA